MARVISAAVAFIVGFAAWSLIAILSKDANPLGKAGVLEGVVFYAPIVGLVLPAAIRCFSSESPVSGIWLLAIAPFAGVLNFIPFLVFFLLSQLAVGEHASTVVAAGLSSAVWAFPLYLLTRQRKATVKSDMPEKPVKLLRRPGRW